MCNRLYKHLKENDIRYRKKFRFQQNHSTEHGILQLTDQVNKKSVYFRHISDYKYPTKLSIHIYSFKKHSLKSTKFAISYRGPKF